jgi:hypothetical protein
LSSPSLTQLSHDQAAGAWFLRSGIQESTGGVARYYRADLGRNLRLSTEITGYSISALVWLYGRSGDREYLQAAERAATFLVDKAWMDSPGIWPYEYPDDGSAESLAYFFDTGIIVRGLLSLWRVTGEQKWLDAAVCGGESFDHFRAGEAFHPILQLPSCEALPYTSQWSRGPGCYQLKSAMAFRDLAVATRRADFAASWERALRWSLDHADEFLPAETPSKTMDRLHAFSYFLEAILQESDRPEIREALRTGIERVSAFLRSIRDEFERSDVNGQLLRVRLLANAAGAVDLDVAEAAEEAARIPAFQAAPGAGLRFAGGYRFGRRGGESIPHSNPVSTAFCLQALDMWSDYQAGHPLNASSLI